MEICGGSGRQEKLLEKKNEEEDDGQFECRDGA